MPVEKFSISLPEELLVDLDLIAQRDGSTRSAVIREATSQYVSRRSAEDESAERRERIDSALAAFTDLAARWGEDSATGLQYLEELRHEDAFTANTQEGEQESTDACD